MIFDDLRVLGTNSYAMKSEKITETIDVSKIYYGIRWIIALIILEDFLARQNDGFI